MADRLVLTDDNPRTENGDEIIQDILSGCGAISPAIFRDRKTAILHALEHMGPSDWLLIAGKGHEDTQEIQGVRFPFSDRKVVSEWMPGAVAP